MVVHESFVTRKPLEFLLIVLVIIFLILGVFYLYTKNRVQDDSDEPRLLMETFNEVIYLFSPESDLSAEDKRLMFKLNYDGNIVQWYGRLLVCEQLEGRSRMTIDQDDDGQHEVVFTSYDPCSSVTPEEFVTYKMTLVDLKTTTFVGKDGVIIDDS